MKTTKKKVLSTALNVNALGTAQPLLRKKLISLARTSCPKELLLYSLMVT